MEARRHPYAVEGWGEGELWTAGARRARARARRRRGWTDTSSTPQGDPQVPFRQFAAERTLGADFAPKWNGGCAGCFAGETDDFADVDLDLDWCTPFQRARSRSAARACRRGEVVTYGELAALAGLSGRGAAAGTVCATNRFWLLVPCHRVVGATGLGGYGSLGVGYKRRLLELEGVQVDAL